VRTAPEPGESLLERYYARGYYGGGEAKFAPVLERALAALARRRARRLVLAFRASDQHGRAPRVLDIGCGRGTMLERLRELGCECHGVERPDFPPVPLAGIDVLEVRLSHLAYAAEIAGAMLRRQQAEAIIDARTRIVDGAVGMVQMALDHLKEGIHLRGMGQKDPLNEWQHEGFDLFSEMIQSLNVDYVRYVMHVEVVQQPAQTGAATEGATATKADPAAATPPAATAGGQPAAAGATATATASRTSTAFAPRETEITESSGDAAPESATAPKGPAQPFVKDEWDKTPRNAPCPCGSGKKFKQCHGR